MSKQLDLFSWTPPCRVFLFPAHAWTSRVREVAATFRGMQPAPAVAYWRQASAGLDADLVGRGVSANEAAQEVEAFQAAVMNELDRLSGSPAPVPLFSGDAA